MKLENPLNMRLPGTQERVVLNTGRKAQAMIDRQTEKDVAAHAGDTSEQIEARIAELRREWDIERALEANASIVIFTSIALGFFVDRRWLALGAMASVFLFQHALQGWCPPVPVMRRLGVRTAREIEQEIEALRLLRGDLQPTNNPLEAIAQARGAILG
jgi:hypothetical protein